MGGRSRSEQDYSISQKCLFGAMQDIVEDMDKGVLSKEEYPYLKDPSGSSMHASSPFSRPPTAPNSRLVQSRRTTAKGPGSTWASRGRASSDDGYSSNSVLKAAVSDPKINGKRIFIFIVGGMTRSELRVAHKLTPQLKREVVLGSTNIDNPKQFVRVW
jgi:syntaxin-binding protein 1